MSSAPPPSPSEQEPRSLQFEDWLTVIVMALLGLSHLHDDLGVLAAFIVMVHQGINANIMSLGGIAIAIGAMVDGAIVMIDRKSVV